MARLLPDWWAGFAMVYEERGTPLLLCGTLSADKLASVYTRVCTEALGKLYGAKSTRSTEASQILPRSLLSDVHEALRLGWRHGHWLSQLPGDVVALVSNALAFLKTGAPSGVTWEVPYLARVHGDLNCRNILYDDKKDLFWLIDFPNVDSGYAATDFAKAEAELVLIMMDYQTGMDGDFHQVSRWAKLLAPFARELCPEVVEKSGNQEDARVVQGLLAIRRAYSVHCLDDSEKWSYRWILAARVLRYLDYPDLTPPKKLLALAWIGQLVAEAGPE